MRVTRGFHEPLWAAETVAQALQRFDEHHQGPLGPVLIVIAGLNEQDNLPAVLAELPATVAGLHTDVVVIDDGSTDDTSRVAREGGAHVVRLERNCGHGTALRAGYKLAGARNARFVATLDADGQWDPADLGAMTQVVLDDGADFVIGSRVLGATMNTDGLRNLGVKVFGLLARVLTGARVTDTSSGLRVLRTEVVTSVRQQQPQYQTSELLVGALLAGFRVAEVATTMRPRMSGESRKGRNGLYGARYAYVMTSTWWRELRDPARNVRERRLPLLTRLVRYALGSVVCLAISEVTLFVALVLGLRPWVASVVASVVGVVFGYPLNRAWTFGRRGRSDFWREVVPYWGSALASAVAAAVTVGAASSWAKTLDASRFEKGVIEAAAYVAAYGVMWILRFLLLDKLLFATENAASGARSPQEMPAAASSTPSAASRWPDEVEPSPAPFVRSR